MSRGPNASRSGERQLMRFFRSLQPGDRSTVLAFAEFMAGRGADVAAQPPPGPREPEQIPRPATESVVGAIKRLSKSYYMLDRSTMLNETSSLMGAHVLQGRPAGPVIDELEALFARYYEKYRVENEKKDT